MSMIYRLRALSDENEDFLRDYDIPFDSTLLEMHNFIAGELGYDPGEMASFFTADQRWERLREFTLFDPGSDDPDGPLPMESVGVGNTVTDNGDRLVYVFDVFANRALYLVLTGTYKAEQDKDYPSVEASEGEPPAQFLTDSQRDDAVFMEAMEDFNDFEGDELYEDEF